MSEKKDLLELVSSVSDVDLAHCCKYVLSDERFLVAPAARKHHHNYKGGLLDHTFLVANQVATMVAESSLRNELITAAIWHDFHKIYEYGWDEQKNEYVTLPYASMIGHIVGGAIEFRQVADHYEVPSDTIDRISHMLLSHHGRKEWGSPVEPATNGAFILHAADMINSRA